METQHKIEILKMKLSFLNDRLHIENIQNVFPEVIRILEQQILDVENQINELLKSE